MGGAVTTGAAGAKFRDARATSQAAGSLGPYGRPPKRAVLLTTHDRALPADSLPGEIISVVQGEPHTVFRKKRVEHLSPPCADGMQAIGRRVRTQAGWPIARSCTFCPVGWPRLMREQGVPSNG